MKGKEGKHMMPDGSMMNNSEMMKPAPKKMVKKSTKKTTKKSGKC